MRQPKPELLEKILRDVLRMGLLLMALLLLLPALVSTVVRV